jgi:hypothetical protein
MADRWNAAGPGGLDNMTLIWLPMVPPTGGAPSNASVGWVVSLDTCRTGDPMQTFSINANHTVTHAASGLCVTAPPPGPGESPLQLQPCGSAPGSQAWYVAAGNTIASVPSGTGNGCVDWNNADEQTTVGVRGLWRGGCAGLTCVGPHLWECHPAATSAAVAALHPRSCHCSLAIPSSRTPAAARPHGTRVSSFPLPGPPAASRCWDRTAPPWARAPRWAPC